MRASPRSLCSFALLLALAFCTASVGNARPADAAPTTLDAEFRAAYPNDAPSSLTRLAGVALARLALPGLQLHSRSDEAADDGGVVLSYADRAGNVRVIVHIAVLPDVGLARRVLDTQLRGVSQPLLRAHDPLLGDLAWADDGGRGGSLVLATQANLAYGVHVLESGGDVPSAASIAGQLRLAMVPGQPVFPQVAIALPATVNAKTGAEFRVYVPGGHPYQLRASGAYVARGQSGPLLRPFAPGPVTVFATAVSDLGCVTVGSQSVRAE